MILPTAVPRGPGADHLPARSLRRRPRAGAPGAEGSRGRLSWGRGTAPAVPAALARLRPPVGMPGAAYAGEPPGTPEGEPFRLALVPEPPPPIWIAALG